MNLDTLFDDFESQLTEPNTCFVNQALLASCNRVNLRSGDEELSLIAPILGTDFVAGFHEQRASWMCIGTARLSVANFAIDGDSQLPKLRKRSVLLEHFIAEMNPPFAVEFKVSAQPSFCGALTEVANGFAFYRAAQRSLGVNAVSLAALDWLSIVEVKDASDVSEWQNR